MKNTNKWYDPKEMEAVTEVACEVAEKAVVEAIWRTSRMAGVSPDAGEAMKFSQAALNLAHVLASLDRIGGDR
jgi:hypothetical protein